MFCPACGAAIKQQDQKYCQDCGATLPPQGGGTTAVVSRGGGLPAPSAGGGGQSSWLPAIPTDLRNRMLIGAGTVVLAVIVLYIVVNAIVSFLLHLVLPVLVVAALLYTGYRVLRARAI